MDHVEKGEKFWYQFFETPYFVEKIHAIEVLLPFVFLMFGVFCGFSLEIIIDTW